MMRSESGNLKCVDDFAGMEFITGLRSGDAKIMLQTARSLKTRTSRQLRELGKVVVKSPSRELLTVIDACLDCLSCATSSDLAAEILAVLYNFSNFGKGLCSYLFSTDALVLALRAIKQYRQGVRAQVYALKFSLELSRHVKKAAFVLQLAGAHKLILSGLRSEELTSDPEFVNEAVQLFDLLLRKNPSGIRLLDEKGMNVQTLVALGNRYRHGESDIELIILSSLFISLDRIASLSRGAQQLVEAGAVCWGMEILAKQHADAMVKQGALKLLKSLLQARPKESVAQFKENGGFELVWNAVVPDAVASGEDGRHEGVGKAILKLASSVLSLFQRHTMDSVTWKRQRKGLRGRPNTNNSPNVRYVSELYNLNELCIRLDVGSDRDEENWDENYPSPLQEGWESRLITFCPELWKLVQLRSQDAKTWSQASFRILSSPAIHASGLQLKELYPPGLDPRARECPTQGRVREPLQTNPTGEGQYLRDMYNTFKRAMDSRNRRHPTLAFDSRITAKDGISDAQEKKNEDISSSSDSRGKFNSAEGKGGAEGEKGNEDEENIPSLEFSSDFEHANLRRAIRVGPSEYDLILQSDTNTTGYTQWFYFSVKKMKKNINYTFNVVNNEKQTSGFNTGMRPVIYSEKEFGKSGLGWTRVAANSISYFHNAHRRANNGVRVSLEVKKDDAKRNTLNPVLVDGVGSSDSDANITVAEDDEDNDPNSPEATPIHNPNTISASITKPKPIYPKPNTTQESEIASASHPPAEGEGGGGREGDASAANPAGNTNADTTRLLPGNTNANSDTYYTLSMSFSFPHEDDDARIAYFYPYTYSFNRAFLSSLQRDKRVSQMMFRQALCRTRGQNVVELLTVTDFECTEVPIIDRPIVFLSSRVHPGEANASWVMKGLLEYLTGSSKEAIYLRKKIVFKIIPILNPDGVINGNYRCNLSGLDLNRHWEYPCPERHPTIYAVKELISTLSRQRPILLYCDFHGHSIMKNCCLYGCSQEQEVKPVRAEEIPNIKPFGYTAGVDPEAEPEEPLSMLTQWKGKERVFPMLLAHRAPDMLSFSDCKFSVLKRKKGSARVVFWRELRIWNSYTMECSFCGSDFGPLKDQHYGLEDYQRLGAKFCQSIFDWISPDRSAVIRAIQDVTKYLSGLDRERRKKKHRPAVVRVPTHRKGSTASASRKSGPGSRKSKS
eukprot:CAMPEP_0184482694 /NCGR_PEP_ID=MMETSP0113_2-20130426/4273_1 /TAXON_ID=91329 /ORGANISM="Norrisiella sphaerica, Strain BC52" /LENGTH=1184 /DNA_ID=CAMNT_0026862581 /DNA_START=101 /DNA_END=3655 /DNA_ORIENTATION=-